MMLVLVGKLIATVFPELVICAFLFYIRFSKQGKACDGSEEDMLYHVSHLFNPLLLFHVFLAEVCFI